MSFEAGQVIIRRCLHGQWCTWAQPMQVISDDEAGLLLWQPAGSDLARLIDADGNTPHEVTPTRCAIRDYIRRHGGVETKDLVLDIVVTPQRQWEWKDIDEFAGRIGHPLYFDTAAAETIRAEGERLIKLVEAGDFPFDGTHTDFRP